MKTLLAVCLLALTLVGCSLEKSYVCIGESETISQFNPDPKVPRIEKLQVYVIKIKDNFIYITERNRSPDKFIPSDWARGDWIEIRTAPIGSAINELEVRSFHPKAKILDLVYEDRKWGSKYHYRGQCK